MLNKPKIIILTGPTAVGKTSLSITLAKKIKGEIISADSMQAYKGMELTSQAPTSRERRAVKHHLIGFLSPSKEYSAVMFSEKAESIIKNIIKRRKIPIVVGGSGLYVKALVDGIFPSKGKDEKLRGKLFCIAQKDGNEALHKRLSKIDPEAAAKIHPNDVKRVVRAIEICEGEKRTKTSLKENTSGLKEKYDIEIFGLEAARDKLYKIINERVDLIFKKGAVKEVKGILRKKISRTAYLALGVRQIEEYLKGTYGIDRAKELLKRDTRRFAKRQFTWFKADKRVIWFDVGKMKKEEVIRAIWNELYS